MAIRVAVDGNGVVIVNAPDQGQSGYYDGVGTWVDGLFDGMPSPDQNVVDYLAGHPLHVVNAFLTCKVENGQLMCRSLAEMQAAYPY